MTKESIQNDFSFVERLHKENILEISWHCGDEYKPYRGGKNSPSVVNNYLHYLTMETKDNPRYQ